MEWLPWAVVDEDFDILRRSRSRITGCPSSSSVRELEEHVEGGGSWEGEGTTEAGGVGKTQGFVCDVMGRWFCKALVPLAENHLLLRRRWSVAGAAAAAVV